MGRRFGWMAGVVLVGLLGAAALPAAALSAAAAVPVAHVSRFHLGAAPSVCTGEPNLSCVERGGGGDISVSPRLVEVGQEITFKLTDTGAYGGVAPGWQFSSRTVSTFGSSPGLRKLRCTGRIVAKPKNSPADIPRGLGGVATCTYRVTSAGGGWQAAVATFQVRYGGLGSYSEESWRVVPKGAYIDGYIRGLPHRKGEPGQPLSGVPVKAVGPSGDSTRTNNEGFYALSLAKAGRYELRPRLRASDTRLRPEPKFSPQPPKRVRVKDKQVVHQDFKLNRGDRLKITFTDASGHTIHALKADGVSSAIAKITSEDANDQPIGSSQNGALKLSVDGGRIRSKAILCGPNNNRIWPGAGSPRSLGAVAPVDLSVDPNATTPDNTGVLKLGIFAGTESGTFTLSARLENAAPSEPGASASLSLTGAVNGQTLQAATSSARLGHPAGFPNASPGDPSSSSSWFQTEADWLLAAKSGGFYEGWEFTPVQVTDGTRYGIYFYRNGQPGSGGVLNSDNTGFEPLLNGSPLPTLAAWSGPQGYHFFQLISGYPGDGLFYSGWPYENGPADHCIRTGPQ